MVQEHDGYPPHLPGGDYRQFLESGDPLAAWVAEEAGRCVGHVSLNESTSPAVLGLAARTLGRDPTEFGVVARLMVDTQMRRSGLGRTMLDHAAAACFERGLTPILDVVDRFAPAIALYERAGWSSLGSVEVQLGDSATLREYVYTVDVR